MSLRFGMLLPGPFFVSAGSSSTKQTSSDLEAKSADYDRGITAALKLFTRRSYLRELDVTGAEVDEYGRGRAAAALWAAAIGRTGSHSQGFSEATAAIRKMDRHYRGIDWAQDAAENDRRRDEKRRTRTALKSGILRWEPNAARWIHWNGAAWQVWDASHAVWRDWG